MKTVTIGKTGIETGILGLGLEHLEKASYEAIAEVVEAALEGGVGYMDLFMPTAPVRDHMGRLMKGRRDRFMIQGHLGACLTDDGQYDRSRDPVRAERHAEDLLRRLGTDYLDTLMVHFVDEPGEWAEVSAPGGTLEIAQRWKRQGRARMVGLSSHKVAVSMAAVESGLVDVLMFPVNPAFDLLPGETRLEELWEADPYTGLRNTGGRPAYTRRDLYLACQRNGVGLVAMKPFAAGWLFKTDNPSGIALSPVQCLEYALSRPGVSLVVPGCRTREEVLTVLSWLSAADGEKDYGAALGGAGWNLAGSCMYCNHCLPCPAGIDVAAVGRLLDGAKKQGVTPSLAAAYGNLRVPASACLSCGECEARCPFGVQVSQSMSKAAALFE